MAVALVDSTVLIGATSARDQYHDVASEIVHAFDNGDLPTGYVTNYALTETLNFVHERMNHATATGLLDRLVESAGFELVHAPRSDFTSGRSLFRQHDGLAFGDATMAAYMRREGIEYLYSFDDDFDAVSELTRLDSAENPFS